jgi:hypothetical protein
MESCAREHIVYRAESHTGDVILTLPTNARAQQSTQQPQPSAAHIKQQDGTLRQDKEDRKKNQDTGKDNDKSNSAWLKENAGWAMFAMAMLMLSYLHGPSEWSKVVEQVTTIFRGPDNYPALWTTQHKNMAKSTLVKIRRLDRSLGNWTIYSETLQTSIAYNALLPLANTVLEGISVLEEDIKQARLNAVAQANVVSTAIENSEYDFGDPVCQFLNVYAERMPLQQTLAYVDDVYNLGLDLQAKETRLRDSLEGNPTWYRSPLIQKTSPEKQKVIGHLLNDARNVHIGVASVADAARSNLRSIFGAYDFVHDVKKARKCGGRIEQGSIIEVGRRHIHEGLNGVEDIEAKEIVAILDRVARECWVNLPSREKFP